MSTNFNLFFYLKEPKRYKSGPVPVYLRITIDCQRSEIAVGRDIDPVLWDLERRRAKGSKEAAKQLNHHLDTVQSKIKDVHTSMIATGDEITARNVKDTYLGINAQSKLLLEIFREHNIEMESLIGNGFSDNTLRTFKSSLKHITAYVKAKYGLEDISIRKVDQPFIKNYDSFLRTKHHKCTPISADKYVKHLKKVILLSLGNRWITENPFMHYKSTAKPSPRTFLTNDELSIIIKKEFAVERLKQVRDIFVFCCYTGLAYVDVQKLKPTEIGIGDDGKQWIFTSRHKTNTPVHLPLLPEAAYIIGQYKHHPICVCKSIVLPVFTNQRMNSYLKEVADLCGIKKWLTFHMARHTFATTITLSNGVPIETVSKMLGHSTIKTTQHYAKVLDSKTSFDMAALAQKLKDQKATSVVDELIQEVFIETPTARVIDFSSYKSHPKNSIPTLESC
ncbi:MAG: site-specific integrase [Mucilaginibacter sp.]